MKLKFIVLLAVMIAAFVTLNAAAYAEAEETVTAQVQEVEQHVEEEQPALEKKRKNLQKIRTKKMSITEKACKH